MKNDVNGKPDPQILRKEIGDDILNAINIDTTKKKQLIERIGKEASVPKIWYSLKTSISFEKCTEQQSKTNKKKKQETQLHTKQNQNGSSSSLPNFFQTNLYQTLLPQPLPIFGQAVIPLNFLPYQQLANPWVNNQFPSSALPAPSINNPL